MPPSGRPVAAVRPEMLQRVDTIVREEGRITNQQLANSFLFKKGGIIHSIRDL